MNKRKNEYKCTRNKWPKEKNYKERDKGSSHRPGNTEQKGDNSTNLIQEGNYQD